MRFLAYVNKLFNTTLRGLCQLREQQLEFLTNFLELWIIGWQFVFSWTIV